MTPTSIQSIISLVLELTYAGVEINALLEEAKANGGQLSPETLDRVMNEVRSANALWEGSSS